MFDIQKMVNPFVKEETINPYEGINMLTLHPTTSKKSKSRLEISESAIEAMGLNLTKDNKTMVSIVTDKENLALYIADMGKNSAQLHLNRCFSSKKIYNLICDTYNCNKDDITRFTLSKVTNGNITVWQILPFQGTQISNETQDSNSQDSTEQTENSLGNSNEFTQTESSSNDILDVNTSLNQVTTPEWV